MNSVRKVFQTCDQNEKIENEKKVFWIGEKGDKI